MGRIDFIRTAATYFSKYIGKQSHTYLKHFLCIDCTTYYNYIEKTQIERWSDGRAYREREAGRQAGRQTDRHKHTHTLTERERERGAGRQTDINTHTKRERETERETDRQTETERTYTSILAERMSDGDKRERGEQVTQKLKKRRRRKKQAFIKMRTCK